MALDNIRFRDIAEREAQARTDLVQRRDQFLAILEKRKYLTPGEQAERDMIDAILNELDETDGNPVPEVCEPLFVGTRALFNGNRSSNSKALRSQKDGVIKLSGNPDDDMLVNIAFTLGLLIADGVAAPPVLVASQGLTVGVPTEAANGGKERKTIIPDRRHPAWKSLNSAYFNAVGVAQGLHDLAKRVLPILAEEGDIDGLTGEAAPSVDAAEFARVMQELGRRGVTTGETQLRRRVNEALDKVQNVGDNGPIADLGIDLPDLEAVTDSDIVADNVRLMGPMIVSAMFDELKAFQVVDKLVDLFQTGMLPIGPGDAGKLLYNYWREAPNRMSETERRTFYATTMGIPGGNGGALVNREFNDLWIRFVSSVSEFVRQNEVDKLLRAGLPSPISHQQVRKTARDLAANLSLHGYGMSYYAAIELQEQIKFMIKLLGDAEVRASYGARDMWQVIDQVATLELGGAKTSSRYRTLATCGTIITAWLANNVDRILAATGPLLDPEEVRYPKPKLSGQKATTHPSDYDLVNACELWLADTATTDSRVEELSQPREAPVMTSKPVPIPAVAREMLDGMGDFGLGMAMRH